MSNPSSGSPSRLPTVLNRARAWFLIKTKDKPNNVAKKIYDTWIDPHGTIPPSKDLVVIRVEVVKIQIDKQNVKDSAATIKCDFDLVVPVDAKSDTELNLVKKDLQQYGEVIEARVIQHFPVAPYLSTGYISVKEASSGILKKRILPETLGLTRRSPGDNPWG